MADDEKPSDRSFDNYIPVWDNKAETLREFKRSVTWWLHSTDLSKTTSFNLAARFAMRQKGSARLRALEFDPKDLEYIPAETAVDPDTDETIEITPPKYDAGILKILEAYDEMVGRSVSDKKGELREKFYMSFARGNTESVSNFALRYRSLIGEMKAEGITVEDGEQAWFFKQKLRLTEVQKQMLKTTLGSEAEVYGACEREAVRLFKRIHYAGANPFPRRDAPSSSRRSSLTASTLSRFRKSFPSSSSSSSTATSSWRSSRGRGGGSANVAEAQEEDYGEPEQEYEAQEVEMEDGGEELCEDDDDELTGLQNMLEVLAAELDEAASEGHPESELQNLEEQIDNAVEALVTLREARSQINALKKDRGYKGKGSSGGKSSNNGKTGACFNCNQQGHWAGDAACPSPGAGKGKQQQQGRFPKPMKKTAHSGKPAIKVNKNTSYKPDAQVAEANVVDLLPVINEGTLDCSFSSVGFETIPTIHEINVIEDFVDAPCHEVLVLQSLSEALAASSASCPGLSLDKHYVAAVDSACNRSCAGHVWIQKALEVLKEAPSYVQDLVQFKNEQDHFRFGNGGVLKSSRRVCLPIPIQNQLVRVWICEIPCASLGCLLGKDFLESLGAILDFTGKKMLLKHVSDRWIPLSRMQAGHFSLSCIPRELCSWPHVSDLPWHAVGVDGVCLVQAEGKMKWKTRSKFSVNNMEADLNLTVRYIPELCGSSVSPALRDAGRPEFCFKDLPKMDPDVHTSPGSSPMALARSTTMAHPTTVSSTSTSSNAYGIHSSGMETAVGGYGEAQGMAEILVAEGCREDDGHPPPRGSDSETSHGPGRELHGGRGTSLRDQDAQEEAQESPASLSDSRDSQGYTRSGWPKRRSGQRDDRSERRLAKTQSRLDQARRLGECHGDAGGLSGRHQEQGQASGSRDHEQVGQAVYNADNPADHDSNDTDSPQGWIDPDWKRQRGISTASRSRSRSSSDSAWTHSGSRRGDLLGSSVESSGSRERLGDDPAVLPAERGERSSSVRKSVGSIGKPSMKDLKKGFKTALIQACRKARRMKKAMGAPASHVAEVMETEYMKFLDRVATGDYKECFIADLPMPKLPFGAYAAAKLPTPSLLPLPRRPTNLLEDEWRWGHVRNWICRDHYVKRRQLCLPRNGTSAPRFLPAEAFTGRRRTVIMDDDGEVLLERADDNWFADGGLSSDTPWLGETWFEISEDWIQRAYPAEDPSRQLTEKIWRDITDTDMTGVQDLPNGDRVFVERNVKTAYGVVPTSSSVPVSTYVYERRNGWTKLEEKVLYRDRAVHRLHHGNLAQKAEILVMIHHESLDDDKLPDGQKPPPPLVGELYTQTEPVSKHALRSGHTVMPSISLKMGYNLLNAKDRKRASKAIKVNRPFCLVIAFPCSLWSNLTNLSASNDPLKRARLYFRRKMEKVLVEFAAEQAIDQVLNGCHFVIENPATSQAWNLVGKLKTLMKNAEKLNLHHVRIDQCHFGLRGPGGGLHKKSTSFLTSSQAVADEMNGCRCDGSHPHEPVIGGKRVTEPAGHYPPELAKALVRAIEREFDNLVEEVNVALNDPEDEDHEDGDSEADDEGEDNPDFDDDGLGGGLHGTPEGQNPQDELVDDVDVSQGGEPSQGERRLAAHLHATTGHRPVLRLARALVLTGAEPSLIKAVKQHKCEVCKELQPTKTRRPATISRIRNFGDRIYCDLISVRDSNLDTHWIAHAVDGATRYQVAKVLENKSTSEVVKFLSESWFQPLGIPAAMTVDMGPEFVADAFMDVLNYHDVVVDHIPVEAPWMNGIAERAGGALKVVLRAAMHETSASGVDDVRMALTSALEACNGDVGETGYSAAQMVLGKNPRVAGAAGPSDLRTRMASQSMTMNEAQFARMAAMKEVAKLAMVRLHYSQALRKASVSRPRVQVDRSLLSVMWCISSGNKSQSARNSNMCNADAWLCANGMDLQYYLLLKEAPFLFRAMWLSEEM